MKPRFCIVKSEKDSQAKAQSKYRSTFEDFVNLKFYSFPFFYNYVSGYIFRRFGKASIFLTSYFLYFIRGIISPNVKLRLNACLVDPWFRSEDRNHDWDIHCPTHSDGVNIINCSIFLCSKSLHFLIQNYFFKYISFIFSIVS